MDGSLAGALSQGSVAIGFSFVDAAAGKFYVGTINDDCSRAALESLLTQVLYWCTHLVIISSCSFAAAIFHIFNFLMHASLFVTHWHAIDYLVL